MAPWMVPRTTSWGVRRNFSRLRLATRSVLVHSPTERVAGGAKVIVVMIVLLLVSGRRVTGGVGCLVEGLTGQGQEHLVEGWRAQGDVVDAGPRRVQRLQRFPQPVGAGLDADPDPAGGLLDLRLAVVEGTQGGRHPWQVLAVAHVDLDHVAARPLLEL